MRRRASATAVHPGGLSVEERQDREISRAIMGPALRDMVSGSLGEAMRIFDLCEPMEEEIRRRYPQKSDEPPNLMKLLYPTRPVRTERLYRAHCREMLARIPETGLDPKSGAIWKSLETLTRAELLGITSEASLRHPLRHADVLMMEMLFDECFPGERNWTDPDEQHGERALAEARREIAIRLVASPERAEMVREVREDANRRAR